MPADALLARGSTDTIPPDSPTTATMYIKSSSQRETKLSPDATASEFARELGPLAL